MFMGDYMTSVEETIATYLQTGGYGTLATNLFIDFMPPSPLNCIAVTAYGGPPPVRGIGQTSRLYDIVRVQIKVRNTSPGTALSTIESIYTYLEGSRPSGIVFVRAVNSRGIYLGKDSNNATIYSLNFEVLFA
jgi:hypothetical protein